jgi:hypothetical protein
MSPLIKKLLLIYLPKVLFMERPSLPPRYVYIKPDPFENTNNNQSLTFPWKDNQRKHIARLTADHIAYIAKQIEHAKNEKEVKKKFYFLIY